MSNKSDIDYEALSKLAKNNATVVANRMYPPHETQKIRATIIRLHVEYYFHLTNQVPSKLVDPNC